MKNDGQASDRSVPHVDAANGGVMSSVSAFGFASNPDARSRLGAARRVLFFGKSMSRTRCTGALVDSLQRYGVEVRWRNLVTWRRWFGTQVANKLCKAEFERFQPDVVFVFFRDLPLAPSSRYPTTCPTATPTM